MSDFSLKGLGVGEGEKKEEPVKEPIVLGSGEEVEGGGVEGGGGGVEGGGEGRAAEFEQSGRVPTEALSWAKFTTQ